MASTQSLSVRSAGLLLLRMASWMIGTPFESRGTQPAGSYPLYFATSPDSVEITGFSRGTMPPSWARISLSRYFT